MRLHKRHSNDSKILFARWIEDGDNRFTATDVGLSDDALAAD